MTLDISSGDPNDTKNNTIKKSLNGLVLLAISNLYGNADKLNQAINAHISSENPIPSMIAAESKHRPIAVSYTHLTVNYSSEGSHIPSLLNNILNDKTKKNKQSIINLFETFGRESNLFDKIIIRKLARSSSSPFEIIVKYNDMEMGLINVGYGVSQSLPMIIEMLNSKDTCFSIQQPEVHLHPKAQSAFGTLLYNSINTNKNTFLIETHSDFIINKFRYTLSKNNNSSKKKKSQIDAKILFFERTKEGNKMTNISINIDGTYGETLPNSYNKFFIDEELQLLSI